jgi:hypothetical protein
VGSLKHAAGSRVLPAVVAVTVGLLTAGCAPECPPAPNCKAIFSGEDARFDECAYRESVEEGAAKRERRCPDYGFVSDLPKQRRIV